jgi:hypothetical protein
MRSTLGTSARGDFVNFNGLRVERSAIPALITFLVESDPMIVPSGEGLGPKKRETVSKLFHMSFREGNSEAMLLAAMLGDQDSLRYLTGLMASRT